MTGEEIAAEAARDPDGPAAQAITRTGEYLGYGLVGLANALDPDLIVIGGGLAALGDALLDPARRILQTLRPARPGAVPGRSRRAGAGCGPDRRGGSGDGSPPPTSSPSSPNWRFYWGWAGELPHSLPSFPWMSGLSTRAIRRCWGRSAARQSCCRRRKYAACSAFLPTRTPLPAGCGRRRGRRTPPLSPASISASAI